MQLNSGLLSQNRADKALWGGQGREWPLLVEFCTRKLWQQWESLGVVPFIMGCSFAVKFDNFQGLKKKKKARATQQVLDMQEPCFSAQKAPSTLNVQQPGCAGLPTHPLALLRPSLLQLHVGSSLLYGSTSPNLTLMEHWWHHLQNYSWDKLLTSQTKTGIFMLNKLSWHLFTELLAP